MNNSNHDRLIEFLLADELSPRQQQQLRDLVADDSSVENEVLEQMWLEPLLRDSFRPDPDEFVHRIETALDQNGADAAKFTNRVLDAWRGRSAKRARRMWIGTFAGLAIAAVIFVAVLVYPNWSGTTVQAAPLPRLQHVQGSVKIVSSNGAVRPGILGTQIMPGDTVATSGDSSAVVSWGDDSRVVLTRDASMTWPMDASGNVMLNEGLAVVTLSSPNSFATKHATVSVPISEFVLATSDRQTDVTVCRGKARLIAANGKSLNVSTGESVVAKAQSVERRNGSATPDTWTEDFDTGLPIGWKQGKLIKTKLPKHSRGAVGTSLEKGDPCRQIWTYSRWEHGLAVVHPDTCLNFVYRFQTADRVQVMTLLRSSKPESSAYDVQVLDPVDVPKSEQWWRIPAGKWYSVSIPLSRLRNPVNRKHPTASFVATAFNFRPQNHACGLVIDRMWLARGTSKKIEFKPFDVQKNGR